MPRSIITAIAYYLPELQLSNEELALQFPEWGAEKIAEKTGIKVRHIAKPDELSSDLAAAAAMKLFDRGEVNKWDIDYVLFCTQTPDFSLPTSACLLQHRLGLSETAGALDYNLGCSGYVYGLSLAKGLIETEQARCVLLLTGESYSKLLDPTDKSVRTIFGDAGAATVIQVDDARSDEAIGPLIFGTDGAGGPNLICRRGGFRDRNPNADQASLWMNGPEIFNFTLRVVPEAVQRLLAKAQILQSEVDLFVFHQANAYMLDHLRKKLAIPHEKFVVAMSHCGNTVSCSIPIALYEANVAGRLWPGARVVLVGFGVGYSWGAALIRWQ